MFRLQDVGLEMQGPARSRKMKTEAVCESGNRGQALWGHTSGLGNSEAEKVLTKVGMGG